MDSIDFGRSKLLIVLAVFCTAGVLFQTILLRRLQQENAGLKKEVASLGRLEQKYADQAKGQITTEELERLRQAKSDLLLLRGQFAALKKQLQDAQAKISAAPVSAPTEAREEPPVRTYTATASAQLKPDEIMVTGGWSTHAGKSIWIIISPTIGNPSVSPNQVTVEYQIIEVPDQVAGNLGLGELKTTQSKTSRHGVFDAQQTEVFWKQLEESDGVDVLSSPKVITNSGREAQVSALSATVIGGMQYQLGPTLDVIPTIQENGSVELKVTGVITLRNEKAK